MLMVGRPAAQSMLPSTRSPAAASNRNDMVETKQCTRCKQHRELAQFRINSRICRPCDVIATRLWRLRNVETFIKQNRRTKLNSRLRKYGLQQQDLHDMLEAQQGRCAICDKSIDLSASIDHCHKTGVVRGLLCGMCNRAIGQLLDCPTIIRRAASYIEKHRRHNGT